MGSRHLILKSAALVSSISLFAGYVVWQHLNAAPPRADAPPPIAGPAGVAPSLSKLDQSLAEPAEFLLLPSSKFGPAVPSKSRAYSELLDGAVVFLYGSPNGAAMLPSSKSTTIGPLRSDQTLSKFDSKSTGSSPTVQTLPLYSRTPATVLDYEQDRQWQSGQIMLERDRRRAEVQVKPR